MLGDFIVRTKLLSALAFLVAGTPALAADIIAPPPPAVAIKAPVAVAYSWTGFYIGGQVGGGWSTFKGTDPTTPGAPWTSINASGVIAGGQIGGNYQIGNAVLGLEASYDWSNIRVNDGGPFAGGAGLTMTLKNDYVATVAGRVGYAFDRVLLYAKGGAAFTRDRLDANNGLAGALAGSGSGSFSRTGWVAGAGIEWAFLPNWSVKAEYNYLGFGQITEVPTTTGNLFASPALVKLDIQTALLGLNFHF
jgi:outer membrane immunogenic protein